MSKWIRGFFEPRLILSTFSFSGIFLWRPKYLRHLNKESWGNFRKQSLKQDLEIFRSISSKISDHIIHVIFGKCVIIK